MSHHQALFLVGPGKAEVRDQPEPPPCAPGEALIRIASVGVCATDVELFEGTMGYFQSGLATWPMIPGHEWSGAIAALGDDCPAHLSVGQHVVGEHATGCEGLLDAPSQPSNEGPSKRRFAATSCPICSVRGGFLRCPRRAETGFFRRDGAFQTLLRFPAAQLHVLPEGVPWELATLAEPLSTAVKAVRLAALHELPQGVRVVVIGDGTIGMLVLQTLIFQRVTDVTVVGTSPSRLARATSLGARAVFNVAENANEDALSAFLSQDGRLPEVVIEAAGHPSALPLALRAVDAGGRVVMLGLSGREPSSIFGDDVVLKQLSIRGSLSSEPEDWSMVAKMLSDDAVKTVVTHRLQGLENYCKAVELVKAPPEGLLKVQLFLDHAGG